MKYEQQSLPDVPASKSARPAAHSVAAMILQARLGCAIRMARKSKAMSVHDLAAASGVAASTISRAESGETDLRVSSVWAIEVALGYRRGTLMRVAD